MTNFLLPIAKPLCNVGRGGLVVAQARRGPTASQCEEEKLLQQPGRQNQLTGDLFGTVCSKNLGGGWPAVEPAMPSGARNMVTWTSWIFSSWREGTVWATLRTVAWRSKCGGSHVTAAHHNSAKNKSRLVFELQGRQVLASRIFRAFAGRAARSCRTCLWYRLLPVFPMLPSLAPSFNLNSDT